MKTFDLGVDPWAPGLPNHWLQRVRDGFVPGLFHDRKCCEDWIRRNEGEEAAQSFANAIWTA